jgi:hypothetical protein
MKAPTMYEREQEAIRRVLQLIAKLRAPWRAHGVSVRRFDVSVKQLEAALNMHGHGCWAVFRDGGIGDIAVARWSGHVRWPGER